MACCAFAAFILSQLVLGWSSLRSRFGFVVKPAGSDNANVVWTYGAEEAPPIGNRGHSFPSWLAVSTGAIAIGALTGAVWLADRPASYLSEADAWCRSIPILENLPSTH
mgnify:CR=1 FL=1